MKSLSLFLFVVLAFVSTAFAAMNGPTGLAVDASGNLYVSNFGANTVQVYNPSRTLIRTISNGVNQPFGVAAGPWGYVYVANFGGGTVTSYDAKGNLVNTITGLVNPLNLTVDGLSDVWVIDQSLTRLSVFDLGNASIYSQSLAGSTTSAFLGVSEYGGLLSLLSSNSTDNVVSALTADLLHSGTSFGVSGTVPGSPSSIVLDSKGSLWVTNANGQVYHSTNLSTAFTKLLTLSYAPSGIAVDRTHNRVYFSHNIGNSVDVYTTTGKFVATIN